MKVKTYIAVSLTLLFHLCGFIGIAFSSYKNWFIQLTPLNLCLVFVLLLINQQKINFSFIFFLIIAFATGMVTEIIGVHTHYLFGNYNYGNVLGIKLAQVPLLIGVNWFIIIYCNCVAMNMLYAWMAKKLSQKDVAVPAKTKRLYFVIDVALLATVFDFIIEPVAVKLGFWYWHEHKIPLYNYASWFLISALLAHVFKQFNTIARNYFAIHLLIIQLLFFLALRIYL